MTTPTIDEIYLMTPEEKAELNKALVRQLGKKILTKMAMGAAVGVVLYFTVKKFDSVDSDDSDTTEED
jgi:hypothetical protein